MYLECLPAVLSSQELHWYIFVYDGYFNQMNAWLWVRKMHNSHFEHPYHNSLYTSNCNYYTLLAVYTGLFGACNGLFSPLYILYNANVLCWNLFIGFCFSSLLDFTVWFDLNAVLPFLLLKLVFITECFVTLCISNIGLPYLLFVYKCFVTNVVESLNAIARLEHFLNF